MPQHYDETFKKQIVPFGECNIVCVKNNLRKTILCPILG